MEAGQAKVPAHTAAAVFSELYKERQNQAINGEFCLFLSEMNMATIRFGKS